MAFSDAFHMAHSIKYDLQFMKILKISITMMTDTLLLFDILSKASMINEKDSLLISNLLRVPMSTWNFSMWHSFSNSLTLLID